MTRIYFVFRGYDGPRSREVRARLREAHRAYIRQECQDCRVVAGGPIMDDAGTHMTGTLLVLEAADKASATRFLKGDPYIAEALFERSELDRWQWGLSNPS